MEWIAGCPWVSAGSGPLASGTLQLNRRWQKGRADTDENSIHEVGHGCQALVLRNGQGNNYERTAVAICGAA
jgi:hypothetical protein